jgi:hypothetical protein
MWLSLVHTQTTKLDTVKPNQALWCHSAMCRSKTECCGIIKSDLLALQVTCCFGEMGNHVHRRAMVGNVFQIGQVKL